MNNRIIKFRVWDAWQKCWNDPALYTLGTLAIWNHSDNGPIAQQYTGLTDSNDKEICEGDILTYKTGVNGQVLYEADHGGYILQYKRNGPNQNYINLNCDVAFESVIVGNIFENSELLK